MVLGSRLMTGGRIWVPFLFFLRRGTPHSFASGHVSDANTIVPPCGGPAGVEPPAPSQGSPVVRRPLGSLACVARRDGTASAMSPE